MSSVSIIKLKVRRGKDSDRKQVILDQGEVGFTTDSHRLFVGDGIVYGGISVSTAFYVAQNIANVSYAQVGDLVFSTSDTTLYALTGKNTSGQPDYSNPAAYINLYNLANFNGNLLPTVSGAAGSGKIWRDTNGHLRVS